LWPAPALYKVRAAIFGNPRMYKALVLLVLCASLSGCGLIPEKKPVTQMTDYEFEQNFPCPNAQTAQGQANSFKELYDFAAAKHPDWDTKQIANFRAAILERKQCLAGVQRPPL
jgi:hypothetical protein